MGLDERGIIAAVQIGTYAPLFVLAQWLARYEPDRRMGWGAIGGMSILRVLGGITHILSENNPTNIAERTIYIVAEAAGQGPLLVATLGFLVTVSQHAIDKTFFFTKGIVVLIVCCIAGIALAIAGAIKGALAKTMDDLHTSVDLRRAGMILFLILFGGILLAAVLCWANWKRILKYRRRLLITVSVTLPFLLVRVLYACFGTWGPLTTTIQNGHQLPVRPNSSGLGKFSATSSKWGIYLIMSVMTEYIAVIIYLVSCLVIPLKKEMVVYEKEHEHWSHEDVTRNKKEGITVQDA